MESALHRLQRGRHILEQQRTRVALMDRAGSASPQSKQLLRQMEQAVAAFEHEVELLQAEEARQPRQRH
ncbi:MAG TPA: hypothetical protein VFA87_04710 [Rhizomicrobium sp.]|nr:hypothetical protein [Rhizomicrobium sp.]